MTMTKDQVVRTLGENRAHLSGFGVARLALFGSVARGDSNSASDVDLLVDFVGPTKFDTYMDLKFFLEDLLHVPVDLVTRKSLKPRLRMVVEAEQVVLA